MLFDVTFIVELVIVALTNNTEPANKISIENKASCPSVFSLKIKNQPHFIHFLQTLFFI